MIFDDNVSIYKEIHILQKVINNKLSLTEISYILLGHMFCVTLALET